ncbi:MAG: response regulator [Balneolaceae bacterium]
MANIQILLVDDHKIVRDGLKMMIRSHPGIEVIGEAENGREALLKLKNSEVDLVIMDINMPEMNGVEATKNISSDFPDIKVLALTMSDDDQHIRQMIQAGASGYILKSSGRNELTMAIENIMEGKHYFSDEATKSIMMDLVTNKGKPHTVDPDVHITDREMEILGLILKELTNNEIAEKLFISPRTVDAHRRNLLQKTGSRNTAGLVRFAMKQNLFPDAE